MSDQLCSTCGHQAKQPHACPPFEDWRPTREQLVELLLDDTRVDAYIGDAIDALTSSTDAALAQRIMEVLHMVEGELSATPEMFEGNTRRDLAVIADSAHRGALLLLCAAWEAKRKKPRPAIEPSPQLSLLDEQPRRGT